MRQPKNKGTDRKPQYGGVPQRYTASDGSKHQVWPAGWHPNMEAYRAAYRAACEAKEREIAATAQAKLKSAQARNIKIYATQHWLNLNPRDKEASNTKLAGSPQRDEHGRVIEPKLRLAGDIKPFWEQWGAYNFDELDHFEVRSWASDQPRRVVDAARSMWREAMTDLHMSVANPMSGLKMKQSKGRSAITVLTDDEVLLLLQCARDAWPGPTGEMVAGVLEFVADTGCRPGEAFALERDWLHPERNRVELWKHNRDPKTGHIHVDGTPGGKTHAAARTVYATGRVFETIAKLPHTHPYYVFTAAEGGPFTQSLWHYYWGETRQLFMAKLPNHHHLHERVRRCVEAGINPSRASEGQGNLVTYELRHHACTRWLELGFLEGLDVARQVAIQLGHKDGDPSLVYSTYGHPDADLALQTLHKLETDPASRKVKSLDAKRRQRLSAG